MGWQWPRPLPPPPPEQTELALVPQAAAAPQPAEPAVETAPHVISAPAASLDHAQLEVPLESGLVLVQTRKEAISVAASLPDTGPAESQPRRRRPRREQTAGNAEPLVQVETHKAPAES